MNMHNSALYSGIPPSHSRYCRTFLLCLFLLALSRLRCLLRSLSYNEADGDVQPQEQARKSCALKEIPSLSWFSGWSYQMILAIKGLELESAA